MSKDPILDESFNMLCMIHPYHSHEPLFRQIAQGKVKQSWLDKMKNVTADDLNQTRPDVYLGLCGTSNRSSVCAFTATPKCSVRLIPHAQAQRKHDGEEKTQAS